MQDLRDPQQLLFQIPALGEQSPGYRMAWYRRGESDAPRTVVCVHGLTRNGRDFDFLSRALAGRYQVLCPDLPGRGQSDWLSDAKAYSHATYLAGIRHVLQQLNVANPYWIGTSLGGIVGMMAANRFPGFLRGLALNDIGCVVSAVGIRRISSYAGANIGYASRTEAELAFRERAAPFNIRDEAHWQHLFAHGFQQTPAGRIRFAYDPAIMPADAPPPDTVVDINLWPMWEAVQAIPVLLVRGAESDILTHETAAEMLSRHPRLTLHEITGTGHAPTLMEASQIALVRDWLDGLD
jgi:pimeloyl-ACP methyl ester carboxylesterase